MKTCVCPAPLAREVRSSGGELLATLCGLCTRPMRVICPVCKREGKDLQKHFRVKVSCFKQADPWEYERWKGTVAGMEATRTKEKR